MILTKIGSGRRLPLAVPAAGDMLALLGPFLSNPKASDAKSLGLHSARRLKLELGISDLAL